MNNSVVSASLLDGKRSMLCAGVISPFLFALVFTLDGFSQPGYSQMAQMVSFLSVQAQNGWIQNVNFILCGLLFLAFASGFFLSTRSLLSRRALIAATAFIALAGLGLINEGFNPTSLPGQPLGVHGTLHDIGFFVIFGSLIVAPMVTGLALVKIAGWRRTGWYSLFSALLTLLLFFGLILSAVQFPQVVGLVNRVQIFCSFLWCAIMAWRLLHMVHQPNK